MAITNASRVADFGSGIGTEGAIIQVDNTNARLGIGTANPQAMLQVGTGVSVYGNSGIVSATSFYGSGANLTGISVDSTALKDSNDVVRVQANTSGAVVTGIVTATSLSGAGTATFAGPLNVGNELNAGSGVNVYGGGSIYIRQTGTGSADKLLIIQNNNSAEVANLNGAGGATFAGDMNIGSPTPNWASRLDVTGGTNQSAITAAVVSNTYKCLVGLNSSGGDAFYVSGEGKGYFAGSVKIGGTAAANEMDEYEEGTFTPTLYGSTGSAGSAADLHPYGQYTKIGRLVHARIQIVKSNLGSWTGDLRIGGLPFTSATATAGSLAMYPSANVDAAMRGIQILAGTTYCVIMKGSKLDGLAPYSEIVTGYYLQAAVTYHV